MSWQGLESCVDPIYFLQKLMEVFYVS